MREDASVEAPDVRITVSCLEKAVQILSLKRLLR